MMPRFWLTASWKLPGVSFLWAKLQLLAQPNRRHALFWSERDKRNFPLPNGNIGRPSAKTSSFASSVLRQRKPLFDGQRKRGVIHGNGADDDPTNWPGLADLMDHDTLTSFAMKLAKGGLYAGSAINMLRGLVGGLTGAVGPSYAILAGLSKYRSPWPWAGGDIETRDRNRCGSRPKFYFGVRIFTKSGRATQNASLTLPVITA
jgi:hypothetical protein